VRSCKEPLNNGGKSAEVSLSLSDSHGSTCLTLGKVRGYEKN